MNDVMIMDANGEWQPLGFLSGPIEFDVPESEPYVNVKDLSFQYSFEARMFRGSAFGGPSLFEILYGPPKSCKYEGTKPIFELYPKILPSEVLEKPLTMDIFNLKDLTVGFDIYQEAWEAQELINKFLYKKHQESRQHGGES